MKELERVRAEATRSSEQLCKSQLPRVICELLKVICGLRQMNLRNYRRGGEALSLEKEKNSSLASEMRQLRKELEKDKAKLVELRQYKVDEGKKKS